MSESVEKDLVETQNKDGDEVEDSIASCPNKRKLTSKVWDHFDKFQTNDGTFATCHYCCRVLPGKSNYGTTQLWRHIDGKCPNYKRIKNEVAEVRDLPKVLMEVEEPVASSSFKKKKLTSKVWEHFDRIDTKDGTCAKCHYCLKVLPGDRRGDKSYGTNQLWRHLNGKCPNYRREKGKGPDLKQQIIKFSNKKNSGTTVVDNSKFNQERSRRDLAEAIILHEYPFSVVDHFAFKKFLKNLQPQFNGFTRQTVISECMNIYESEERKLRAMLDKLQSRVSLTCDLWTSLHDIGCLVLTAHFIDHEWRLWRRTLNFCKIESRYAGECISKSIVAKLSEWDIDKKLFSLVLENCSANDVAVKEIQQFLIPNGVLPISGELFRVHCCTRVLNLIVQDCLNSMNNVLLKIRESIKHVKASSARQETFKMYMQQLNAPKNSLLLDVPKRWDSTYRMLDVAVKFKDVFCCLASIDDQYTCLPSDEEWDNVKIVCECLSPLFELAEFLSSTKHPTFNVYFTMICELKVQLKDWANSENDLKSSLSCKMLESIDSYWTSTYLVLAIASILDPRLKMKPIEFYFPMIYGGEFGHVKILDVRTCLAKLYDEYQYVLRPVNNEGTQVHGSQTPGNPTGGGTTSGEVSSLSTAWSNRMKRLSKYLEETSSCQSTKTELDLYLEESVIPLKDSFGNDFDVLSWWKISGAKYPILGQIAKDLLAIPLSSVKSEAVFNLGGQVIDQYKSCMSTKIVQSLICAQDWLRSEYEAQAFADPDALSTIYSFHTGHASGDEDLESIAESIIE